MLRVSFLFVCSFVAVYKTVVVAVCVWFVAVYKMFDIVAAVAVAVGGVVAVAVVAVAAVVVTVDLFRLLLSIRRSLLLLLLLSLMLPLFGCCYCWPCSDGCLFVAVYGNRQISCCCCCATLVGAVYENSTG